MNAAIRVHFCYNWMLDMPEGQTEITLGLLNAVEESHNLTQRVVAKDLGVALGLINSYLKRCIAKGFVKISRAPANRYAYYLTAAGFSEKSRLTAEYLTSSFNFFRNARQECVSVFRECERLGQQKVILAGASDLAEIFFLCSHDSSVEIIGIVDDDFPATSFLTIPVYSKLEAVGKFDAAIVTNLTSPQVVFDKLAADIPLMLIYAISILGVARPTMTVTSDFTP